MLWNMISDFIFFFYLYFIGLLAYAIPTQGLLYPNEYRFREIFYNICFKPIMMLFGEMFLGEVHNYKFDGLPSPDDERDYCSVAATRSNFTEEYGLDPDVIRCPEYHTFLSVINVIYIFCSNVLLLNLLIAMFTYSFDRVQNNTAGDMDKWNTIRYDIISEYYHKSPFVPPFNIIEGLFNLVKKGTKCSNCCDTGSVGDDPLEWRNKQAMSMYRRPMRSTSEYLQNWNYCQEKGCLKIGKSITDSLVNLEYATMANYTEKSRKVRSKFNATNTIVFLR